LAQIVAPTLREHFSPQFPDSRDSIDFVGEFDAWRGWHPVS
jgi:hypothetical protein